MSTPLSLALNYNKKKEFPVMMVPCSEPVQEGREETETADEYAPVISSEKEGVSSDDGAHSAEPVQEGREETEIAHECAPIVSSELLQEGVAASDDYGTTISSEPVQEEGERDQEAKTVNEDAPIITSGPVYESEGAAADEHEDEIAPVISSEPMGEEQGAADVELRDQENLAESANQPESSGTELSLQVSDRLVEQDEQPDKPVEQDKETSGGEKEERLNSLEVTADLDKLAKPDEETSLTSGDAEKRERSSI